MKIPWIHITKSFRQYCLAVSLPFAFVLQKGYNFYTKKWFSTLCTQRVNLMTICFYYFFVMLMHWTQNIESFGKFQQVVLFLFPYVFPKVYYFYQNMLMINYANYMNYLKNADDVFHCANIYIYVIYTQTFPYHYLKICTISKV